MMKNTILTTIYTLALLTLLLIGCTAENEPKPQAKDSTEVKSIPVATVDDSTIDWRELRRSYHLDPRWQTGATTAETYRMQLDYLINRKLFARDAIALNLTEDPDLSGYLDFIHEKEMIKELYRQEVADKVDITEEEYQQAYAWSKKRVQFEFVYTPDSSRALAYRQQLAAGPVDDILLMNPENEQKGTSPLFGYGDMAAEIERVVFEMAPNEIAGPIPVDDRYMVLKLIDGEVDAFMSEMDFAENKSKIEHVMRGRRERVISDQFIDNLMRGKNVELNPPVFRALATIFSQVIQAKETEQPFPIHISDQELAQTQLQIDDIRNETLVSFAGGQFTVQEFLNHLANMPSGMRPQVKIASQLKKAVGVAVRNHFLVQEAKARGLDQSPQVQYETQLQVDDALATIRLRHLGRQIDISEQEIEAFRQKENFARVNDQMGGQLTDSRIREILFDVKFNEQQLALADSLRSRYPVDIDTARLQAQISDPEAVVQKKPIGFAYQEVFQ